MVVVFASWRFLLGVGVGGDYALNASIISEYSSRNFRGSLLAALFAMQGFGILGAALVTMAVLACFKVRIDTHT
jgi:PHS family inorganic phosphate transporter-like MFS transporter